MQDRWIILVDAKLMCESQPEIDDHVDAARLWCQERTNHTNHDPSIAEGRCAESDSHVIRVPSLQWPRNTAGFTAKPAFQGHISQRFCIVKTYNNLWGEYPLTLSVCLFKTFGFLSRGDATIVSKMILSRRSQFTRGNQERVNQTVSRT